MSFIYLAPGRGVDETVIDVIEACLSHTFRLPVRRSTPFGDPCAAYDRQRHQYISTEILRMLKTILPRDAVRLLGIVDRDIFIPMLTFVFGQAQLGGDVALVSLTRLRQEFYGLSPDPDLLLDRARKEAVHEVGHTFGLTHCRNSTCVMSLSTSIEQVDVKTTDLCMSCRTLLWESIGATGKQLGAQGDIEEDR